MKILVVSDNHGDRDILAEIEAQFQTSVDLMVHAGDSEMTVDDPLFQPMKSVVGNNDFGQAFPAQQIFDISPTDRLLVTHGHRQNVNFTMTNLALLAQSQQASIVCYGHTHQLAVTYVDHVLYVNPGSITLPRGEYARLGGTFAIIEVQPTRYQIQYYNRSLNPVPSLAFEFQRS